MPITTFHDNVQRKINSEEISDLLKEMGKAWIVVEHEIISKKWFSKKIEYRYELLYKLNDIECQIINFYRDNNESSINTYVCSEIIVAYMYGYLANI